MQRPLLILLALAAIGICAVVYALDPAEQPLMPKCVFKLLTGFDCPGCGFQRALHAFLHGQWASAARYNLFLLLALPYLLSLVVSDWLLRGHPAQGRWQHFTHHRHVLIGYLVLYVAWGIVRNLVGL